MSTGDDEAPGNYGLKDQVAVLKWVKKNIDRFSGNPDDVTISGQSSGGASVHYHLMSPLTDSTSSNVKLKKKTKESLFLDLFKKAISQSGLGLALWAYPNNDVQKMVAKQQGQFVGCVNRTNQQLIECLRTVPAETIVATQDNFRVSFWLSKSPCKLELKF